MASRLHTLNAGGLEVALGNVYTMLRQGGVLAVRAFVEPLGGMERGSDEILGVAEAAGFRVNQNNRHHAPTANGRNRPAIAAELLKR